MDATTRRRLSVAGWVLVAVAVLAIAVLVVALAAGARTSEEFDRWVGWANIGALPLGALGLIVVIVDRVGRKVEQPDDTSEPGKPTVTQNVIALSEGSAQGVIGGDIHNHQLPPDGRPQADPDLKDKTN